MVSTNTIKHGTYCPTRELFGIKVEDMIFFGSHIMPPLERISIIQLIENAAETSRPGLIGCKFETFPKDLLCSEV